jgi:uncharacterized SAM-binding protein YcdF (DUF218 family)
MYTGPAESNASSRAPAQVAIVLGAAVGAGGMPSATLKRRVRHAALLVRNGLAERLLLTGGIGNHPPSEAEVMRRLAEAEGVTASRIVLEERARTTMESAAACARIMAVKGWHRVLVVTDSYHLPRALLAFRAYGVTARGSPPADGRQGTPLWRWIYLHLREVVALPWYLLQVAVRHSCMGFP